LYHVDAPVLAGDCDNLLVSRHLSGRACFDPLSDAGHANPLLSSPGLTASAAMPSLPVFAVIVKAYREIVGTRRAGAYSDMTFCRHRENRGEWLFAGGKVESARSHSS
jgi:hypothetical protein